MYWPISVILLGGKRPAAHAGAVGLHDPKEILHRLRRNAGAGVDAQARATRTGHIGISAMIDVKQGRVRAFEDDPLSLAEILDQHVPHIINVRPAAAGRSRGSSRKSPSTQRRSVIAMCACLQQLVPLNHDGKVNPALSAFPSLVKSATRIGGRVARPASCRHTPARFHAWWCRCSYHHWRLRAPHPRGLW